MNQSEMVKLGMALGLCYAAYKFAPHPAVKAGALAVAAVAVARKTPILAPALGVSN